MKATAPAEPQAAAALPPQNVRTLISFLLFVHFFSLAVVLIFNNASTDVAQKLRRMPGLYLQALYMDVDFDNGQPFRKRVFPVPETALTQRDNPRDLPRGRRGRYHLTQGEVYDNAFFVEVEIPDAEYLRNEGSKYQGERKIITIPSPDLGPRQRYLRYHTLAWEAARLNGQEEVDAVLLGGIGGGILNENGVPKNVPCRVRVWRMAPLTVEQANHPNETVRDPWNKRPPAPDINLEGVIFFDKEGQVQFSRTLPINEVAPPPDSPPPGPTGSGASPAIGPASTTPPGV